MHRALDALLHHGAGHLVRLVYIAVEMVIVGVAAARADKFRKAVPAFFSREQTGIFEFFPDVGTGDPLIDAAHVKILVPRKLVAGIEVAAGDDGKILVARAARRHALRQAGPALEVDVEMEEILPYEKAFYRYLDTNEEANALIKEIEQTKDLPEQEKIDKVIKTFKLTR